MIGGTDIIFKARADIPAADIIIRIVRRHWRDYVFQDADDPDPPAPRNSDYRIPSPSGREFFLYKDLASALIWEARGAVPENANTLIHVIMGKHSTDQPHRSITVVCDILKGDVERMIDEIFEAFQDYNMSISRMEEAQTWRPAA